jgi:hypothetical protein
VRGVTIRIVALLAQARERLVALVRWRPSAPAIGRLAGRLPGTGTRIDPAEAAAYEEAAREAYRAATLLEAARPVAPAPTATLPAPSSGAVRSVAFVSSTGTPGGAAPAAQPTWRQGTAVPIAAPTGTPAASPPATLTGKPAPNPAAVPTAAPVAGPAPKPAPKPAVAARKTEAPAPTSRAGRPGASGPAQTEPAAATPTAEPAREPVTAERPARRSRRPAGETAPDHLLAPPKRVSSAADDFFDGLVRRVEGDH